MPFGLDRPPEPLVEIAVMTPGLENPGCASERLFGTVAGDGFKGGVELQNPGLGVGDQHRIASMLESGFDQA